MTEEPRATLLPCPMCGREPLMLKDHTAQGFYIVCTACHCCTPTESEAIAAWNRRATPAVRDGLRLDTRALGEALVNASDVADQTLGIDGKTLVLSTETGAIRFDLVALAHAIAAWNRRATPAVRDGLVEALRDGAATLASASIGMPFTASIVTEAANFIAALSLRPAETRVKELLDDLPLAQLLQRERDLPEYQQIENLFRRHGTDLTWRLRDELTCTLMWARWAEQARDFLASISEPARTEEGKEPVAWLKKRPTAFIVRLPEQPRLVFDETLAAQLADDAGVEYGGLYERDGTPTSTLEITEEAVEAAAKALARRAYWDWDLISEGRRGEYLHQARAALEASLPFLSQTGGEAGK